MATVSAAPGIRGPVSAHFAEPHDDDIRNLGPASNDGAQSQSRYANGLDGPGDETPTSDYNGASEEFQTPTSSRPTKKADPAHVFPMGNKGLRAEQGRNYSGSDADSLLDLYGRQRSIAERSIDSSSRFRNGSEAGLIEMYARGGSIAEKSVTSNRTRNNSQAGLIDLYARGGSIAEISEDGSRYRNDSQATAEAQSKDQGEEEEEEVEQGQSSWIHRDKLAIIERQEMQAAGITPPPMREMSRSKQRKDKGRDHNAGEEVGAETPEMAAASGKRRKTKTSNTEESAETVTGYRELAVRSAEEIVGEEDDDYGEEDEGERSRSPSPIYRQATTARSSSSRIPIPRSTPTSMPHDGHEKTTGLPRRRNPSGTWNEMEDDGGQYTRNRSRGNSAGSQAVLDDPEGAQSQGPSTPLNVMSGGRPGTSGSPAKVRVGSSGKGGQHVRKTSTSTPPTGPQTGKSPASTASPRSPSNPLRPKSRSGLEPRPPTGVINRPEGEAPWIKDMYKPDPMLPPDQQILPTHAKRLKEEEERRRQQWEQAQRDSAERQAERQAKLQQSRRKDATSQGHSSSPSATAIVDGTEDNGNQLSPIAMHTHDGLLPTTNTHNSGDDADLSTSSPTGAWPLGGDTAKAKAKPITDKNPAPAPPNSPLPTTTNGGYSPMPRIRSTNSNSQQQQQQGDQNGSSPPPTQGMDPFDKERLARTSQQKGDAEKRAKGRGGPMTAEEEEEKEKSPGCCAQWCVVM